MKAVYTDSHGTKTEVKSSIFKDNVVLKGFGRSQKQTVQLFSVDTSENESTPVSVEIEPQDAPIYSIMESLDVYESWGGFKMAWENPLQEQIIMYVYQKTDEGWVPLETIASSTESGSAAIRGLASEPTEFQIRLRESVQPVAHGIYVKAAASAHNQAVVSLEKFFQKTESVYLVLAGGIVFGYGFGLDEIMLDLAELLL